MHNTITLMEYNMFHTLLTKRTAKCLERVQNSVMPVRRNDPTKSAAAGVSITKGIFATWNKASKPVTGYLKATHKAYETMNEAH